MPETKIIVASDLHCISDQLTDHGEYFETMIEEADGKAMNYCTEIVQAFLQQVIAEQPEVLILTGDLTFNGAKISHQDMADMLSAVEDAGIPVLVIPGNHDIDYSGAASFSGNSYTLVDSVSADEFREIYQDYGYSGALSYDSASASYVWQLDSGIRLLFVDVNATETYMTIPEETLQWVEAQLKDAQKNGSPVLSFSHQNLYQHSILSSGYVINNAGELIDLLKKYNVSLHMSGHMHLQHIQTEDGLTEIASSSLMVAPLQYGILQTSADAIAYHTEQTQGTAADGTDLNSYAVDFFKRISAAKFRDGMTQENADDLAAYVSELNYAYFSGNLQNVQLNETYSAELSGSSFTGQYIASIEAEAGNNYTELAIDLK